MIDVALYLDISLRASLNGNSVEFIEAFMAVVEKNINLRIVRGMSKTSSSLAFQVGLIRPTDRWFVGAFSIIKTLDSYYTTFALGRFTIGTAQDFLSMERQAEEIYTESFENVDDMHETLIYNTAVDQLPMKPTVWTLEDFKEPV